MKTSHKMQSLFSMNIWKVYTTGTSGILTTWLVKVCTGIYRYIPVYTVIYYATLRKSGFWYEKLYTILYQVWKFRNFSYVVWDGMRKYGYETVWNSMKQYETVWNEMYEVCTSIYWYILSHARISCILWMHIPTHTSTCQHVIDFFAFWIQLHPAGPPESGTFAAALLHRISSTSKFTFHCFQTV